jgi:nitrilase
MGCTDDWTGSVKVAAIQMTTGPDVAANLEVADALLDEAAQKGVKLAVLPENFAFMGLADADKRKVAEVEGEGPIQAFLSGKARAHKMWIIGGTAPVRPTDERVAGESPARDISSSAGAAPNAPLREGSANKDALGDQPARPGTIGNSARSDSSPDGRPAAASLVYDDSGKLVARYDKIHLFDVDLPGRKEPYRESANVAPGSAPKVVETPVGRVGLSVCYDMRFPELYRRLSTDGAQILSIPSAFTTPTGRAHWETLLRARAIENLCFVIAPAQSGIHASGRETYGDSMIVDYWGRILARRPRGRGVVIHELDLAGQAKVREEFPALGHRVF